MKNKPKFKPGDIIFWKVDPNLEYRKIISIDERNKEYTTELINNGFCEGFSFEYIDFEYELINNKIDNMSEIKEKLPRIVKSSEFRPGDIFVWKLTSDEEGDKYFSEEILVINPKTFDKNQCFYLDSKEKAYVFTEDKEWDNKNVIYKLLSRDQNKWHKSGYVVLKLNK